MNPFRDSLKTLCTVLLFLISPISGETSSISNPGICPWGLDIVLFWPSSHRDVKKTANCVWKGLDEISTSVTLLNASFFESVNNLSSPHNRSAPGSCSVVLFYSPTCPFSIQAAPYFNALPHAFPPIDFYAIDGSSSPAGNLLYQFVIPALPSIIVFHNNWPFGVYNHSDYNMESFTAFIAFATNLPPLSKISSHDQWALPTRLEPSTDTCLVLAWVFTLSVVLFYAGKSLDGIQRVLETLKNIWREEEERMNAHPHED
ncbi:Thioredoxin domain containing 15 [Caligus rogercresseyi]|uniref:Thioredoxin domain containing 15 n=1 Tax=Caligus rogercresseyi TaxID=217165 RepID=A0A7T8GK74_CALRO|nr:Thioredoxin domain containing 15 [Caligus rogercresseyi]